MPLSILISTAIVTYSSIRHRSQDTQLSELLFLHCLYPFVQCSFQVPRNGDSMYAAIHVQLDADRRWNVRHLRYQSVLSAVLFRKEIWRTRYEQTALQYTYRKPPGFPDECCGPYSYRDLLLWHLEEGFVGDFVTLNALQMAWNVRITVVNGVTLRETRLGHDLPLHHAGIHLRLLWTDDDYYSAIGE